MATAVWAEDPELLDAFRAEVRDRVGALQAGLLALEGAAHPRQLVRGLFRDAHTVKGSARVLGLDGVLRVAHGLEDLLGLLREGRLEVRPGLVDLLLCACDVIARALPGGDLDGPALDPVVDALAAVAGGAPVAVPPLPPLPGPPAPPLLAVPAQAPAAAPVHDGALPPVAGRPPAESVRVSAEKVHGLLQAVGEAGLEARRVEQATGALLALARDSSVRASAVRQAAAAAGTALPPELTAALDRLTGAGAQVEGAVRGLRELVEDSAGGMAAVRDGALGLAMVPVRSAYAPLPRLVREVARSGGREVELVLLGDDVELDKQVLEAVTDALTHLVTNAVDHGCRPPAERRAAGRPERCTVTVRARSGGGTVVLEVADDGDGIDEDAVRARAVALGLLPAGAAASGPALLGLLCTPAFSTSTTVTATSGRGVGLDVVAAAVEGLGGSVEVRSTRGAGTTFVLTLPVTLGVLRCLVARVGGERYALPVTGVVESVSLRPGQGGRVHTVAGAAVLERDGACLPLLDLAAAVGAPAGEPPRAAVVVRSAAGVVAWAVDRLEGEAELVVSDLGPFLGPVAGTAGCTLDADGSVLLLLDLRELAERAARSVPAPRPVPETPPRRPRVLVVEDSVGVRELERVVLEGAGFDVVTAVDGLDGAARLRGEPVDLVLSDVEMPGMDGLELTRTVRRTRGWEDVPVVLMTSRGEDAARQAGLDAGCSAYLLKSEFDQDDLVATVRRMVGG